MDKLTIRQIRLMNEKTQEEMAEVLKITTQAYVNKELGKTRFYFDEVVRVCKTFGIDIRRIIA